MSYDLAIIEFQEANCRGCFYADAAEVGTGRPCCTYWQQINLEAGKCLTRKEEQSEPAEVA